MRSTRAKVLFEHVYDNGNKLTVTEKGFTLWDMMPDKKRWVLDASTLQDENQFCVSKSLIGADDFIGKHYPSFHVLESEGERKHDI